LCSVLSFSIFCVFGICHNGSSAVCYSTQSLLKDGTVTLQSTGKGVKLRANNLRFSYTSSREVLLGVSLSAEPGQSIALVGASGSGKSTIVKLLLRLYDPDSGSLFLDDHDLRSLSQVQFQPNFVCLRGF
jgi:ABC-type multidrug transport system fused ATPase/permease subunit